MSFLITPFSFSRHKVDALLAILNKNGLVTEAELLDKLNEIKGFK